MTEQLDLQQIRRADTYLSAAAATLQGDVSPEARQFVDAMMGYDLEDARELLNQHPALKDTVARISMVSTDDLMTAVDNGANSLRRADDMVRDADSHMSLLLATTNPTSLPTQQAQLWSALERAGAMSRFEALAFEYQRAVLLSEISAGQRVAAARRSVAEDPGLNLVPDGDRAIVQRERDEALRLSLLGQDRQTTALFEAAENLNLEHYDALVRAGADPNQCNAIGETPLQVAARVAEERGDASALEAIAKRTDNSRLIHKDHQQKTMEA